MMKTVDVRIQVMPDGVVLVPALSGLNPGEYNAVLVIEAERPAPALTTLNLPMIDLGPWPEHLSLRREDLYGDDGR
jgi:hypothetical protein